MAMEGQIALTVLMGVLLLGVAVWLTRLEDWRSYTPLAGGGVVGDETGHAHHEKPSGIIRWFTTVDHKDIGILYGTYAVIAFAWGGLAAFLMRTELVTADITILPGTQVYNALLTSHGITMLFLFGTPILAAFANYFVPLFIDANDMAFPRINAIAFWLLPPGALLVWAGFFLAPFADAVTGGSAMSWTMYPPLSAEQTNPANDLMLLGLHLTGVSATMGAINFIATILDRKSVV